MKPTEKMYIGTPVLQTLLPREKLLQPRSCRPDGEPCTIESREGEKDFRVACILRSRDEDTIEYAVHRLVSTFRGEEGQRTVLVLDCRAAPSRDGSEDDLEAEFDFLCAIREKMAAHEGWVVEAHERIANFFHVVSLNPDAVVVVPGAPDSNVQRIVTSVCRDQSIPFFVQTPLNEAEKVRLACLRRNRKVHEAE